MADVKNSWKINYKNIYELLNNENNIDNVYIIGITMITCITLFL